jgi:hypothetical protein
LRDQVLAEIDIAIILRGTERLQGFQRFAGRMLLPFLRADGGKMQRLQGLRRQKPRSPMRITFQVSSSQAAAPVTTRLGRNCSICTLAAAALQIAQRGFVGQQEREAIGEGERDRIVALHARVSSAPASAAGHRGRKSR